MLLTSRHILHGHQAVASQKECDHRYFTAHRLSHRWNDIGSISGKHGIGLVLMDEAAFITCHYVSDIRVNILSEELEELS
jgi:hypothetical protein